MAAIITAGTIDNSCAEKQLNGLIEKVWILDAAEVDTATTTVAAHAVTAWGYNNVGVRFEPLVHSRGAAKLSISDSVPAEGGRSVTGQLSIMWQGMTAADLVGIEEARVACKVVAVVKYFSQKMFVVGFDALALEEVAMLPDDAESAAAEEFGGAFTSMLAWKVAQNTLPLEYTGTEAALTA